LGLDGIPQAQSHMGDLKAMTKAPDLGAMNNVDEQRQ
jgi:hypothetical protein